MKKFNNLNVFLGGKVNNFGKELYTMQFYDVYEHRQPKVYYEGGVNQIDDYFSPNNYLQHGYVPTLYAYANYVSIYFMMWVRSNMVDLGVIHFYRDKISRYEIIEANDLEVIKTESFKHEAKYLFKNMGLVGSTISVFGTDKIINVNTKRISGIRYKLYYFDEENIERCVSLYSSPENKNEVVLFLNTYFKKDLPESALNPVSNSGCYIATACYRDLYCEEVVFFRWYRDNVLNHHFFGRLFIKIYYCVSPIFYKYLFNNQSISGKIKMILDRLYKHLTIKHRFIGKYFLKLH